MIRSLLNRVMSPGIHFMRRWTLAARFGLLSGAASLMVVLLSVYGGVQSVSAWRGTRLEVEGVAQVDALTTLGCNKPLPLWTPCLISSSNAI